MAYSNFELMVLKLLLRLNKMNSARRVLSIGGLFIINVIIDYDSVLCGYWFVYKVIIFTNCVDKNR